MNYLKLQVLPEDEQKVKEVLSRYHYKEEKRRRTFIIYHIVEDLVNDDINKTKLLLKGDNHG